MNLKFYKWFGTFLIILTFLPIICFIYLIISSLSAIQFSDIYDVIGILLFIPYIVIIFILMFLPGLFYYRVGIEKCESNKLVFSSSIIHNAINYI